MLSIDAGDVLRPGMIGDNIIKLEVPVHVGFANMHDGFTVMCLHDSQSSQGLTLIIVYMHVLFQFLIFLGNSDSFMQLRAWAV